MFLYNAMHGFMGMMPWRQLQIPIEIPQLAIASGNCSLQRHYSQEDNQQGFMTQELTAYSQYRHRPLTVTSVA